MSDTPDYPDRDTWLRRYRPGMTDALDGLDPQSEDEAYLAGYADGKAGR